MARDKVDDLYDNLKEDGWVENSREHFREYFLAPGEQGYKNRKALYDNMKEDGYVDSPTYEEFARRMGLRAVKQAKPQANPAAKTNETTGVSNKPASINPAKSEGTPLSDEDKRRMSAWADDMMAGAEAGNKRAQNRMDYTMGNAGLQIKQVKLGENRHVVEKKPAGPDRKPTYITESGNEFESRAEADIEQNAVDEYKDSMTVEGQIRAAEEEEKRLNGLMRERMAEIDKERSGVGDVLHDLANESHGMPGGVIDNNGLDRYRIDDRYVQLEAAARKNRLALQTLRDKKAGKMDDFWHSIATTMFNGYTFSDGLSDMNDARALTGAQKYIDAINEKRAAGQPLTKEEEAAEAILRNAAVNEQVQGMYGGDYGAWSRAGAMLPTSLDMMKDIMLTPGATGIAKGLAAKTAQGLAKGVAKVAGEKAAKNIITRGILKGTGILVGAHGAGALVSNTAGIGHTAGEFSKNLAGNVTVDKNGNYGVENQEGIFTALANAERTQAAENGSEMFGTFIPGIGGTVQKGLEKIGLSKISNALTNIGKKDWYKRYSAILESGGYNGIPGEALEEYEGMMFDALTGNAAETWEQLKDPRTHVDIWLGTATMGALMGGLPMGVQAYHTGQYYRYKHKTDVADKVAAYRMSQEKWDPIREQIDGTENGQMADVVMGIMERDDLSVQEKQAALNYVRDLTKMRGYNIAEANNAGKEKNPDVEAANERYAEGYDATDRDTMANIKRKYDYRREQIADLVNEDMMTQLDNDPIGALSMIRSDDNWSDFERDQLVDYINAKQSYEGMLQRVRDDIDTQTSEQDALIDAQTKRGTTSVQHATMKIDDRSVHVIDGNIVMNDDGTINTQDSDESILIRDEKTGKVEFTYPSAFLSVDDEIDANELKAAARENVTQTVAQSAADNMDGVLPMNVGDVYTVNDGGGDTQITIVGPATDENGVPLQDQYVVQMADGTQTVFGRQDIQSKADAAVPPVGSEEERIKIEESNGLEREEVNEVNGGVTVGPETIDESETVVDSMPMIGEGEDAEPDFSQATPQRSHAYLYNEAGLSREEADQFINENKKAADKTLSAIQSKKPKMGTSLAKYRKETAEWQQKTDEAQAQANYWQAVKDEQQKILAAEQQARAEREAAIREQAIAEEQARQKEELRKREEQEQLGSNNVAPQIRDKWAASPKIEGAANEIVLANGDKIAGRYVLVESGAATPSHNPNAEFVKNEGFPVDENGQSVNDRDYERDKDAQAVTRSIASRYDSRAMQTPVVVSNDGVVLSGNGRTMAGELAAQNGTDTAYIEHLKKYGQQYGFSAEQVESMQHPRVLFVPDDAMPYTADTFAKFNQQEMKGQSKSEQAVKLGKIVDDGTFGRIIQSINAYDTLGDFYADSAASANAIQELQKAGVINQAQYAEMFDGDTISAQGREMLENMLIGKAFESNPDAVREITAYKSVRQSIIYALAEISNNIILGEGYSLESELAQAIDLVYQARNNGGYKAGEPVSSYARQLNLFPFDEGESVADYTNATVLMLADVLNDSRLTRLKKILTIYNHHAQDSANGQTDMFTGGVETKDDILNAVKSILNNGTEQEQQSAINEAVERRTAEAAGNEQDGAAGDGDTGGKIIKDKNEEGRVKNPFADDNGRTYENSGLSDDEAEEFMALMEASASEMPDIELTPANWAEQFGEAGHVTTPIGEVKMGENQIAKLFEKGRSGQFGMIKPTLESPHVIIEIASNDVNGDAERETSYMFIRSFSQKDGKKIYYFKSVTVKKDGMEVSISSHIDRPKRVREALKKGKLLYRFDGGAQTEHLPADVSMTTSQELKQGNSTSKDSTNLSNDKGLSEKIAEESKKVDVNPTDGQKEAGNYKKGHVNIGAFDVTIEQPKDSVRSGVDRNGKKWETKMNNTYGYIRGTEGVDGDHIDVFLADDMSGFEDKTVYVVDQYNEDGSFDEHKVMMGFNSEEEARTAYLSNYEKGWEEKHKTIVTPVSLNEFEKWVDSSHRKTKAFAEYKSVKIGAPESTAEVAHTPSYQKAYDNFFNSYKQVIATGGIPNVKAIKKSLRDVKRRIKTLDNGMATGVNSDAERINVEENLEKLYGLRDAYTDTLSDINRRINDKTSTEGDTPLSLDDMRSSIEETAQEAPVTSSSANPSGNKLVTDERYAMLRDKMRKKLGGQLNMGIDPEILAIGTEMAVYHIEKGARKFTAYAKAMIADLGDAIRPYLKSFYNAVRDMPEAESAGLVADMDSYDDVRKVDIANFDKQNTDAMATAAAVMAEEEAERQRKEAEEKLKEQRNKNTQLSLFDEIEEQPNVDDKQDAPAIDTPAIVSPEMRPVEELSGNSAAYQERETQIVELVEDISDEIESRAEQLEFNPETTKPLSMTDVKKLAAKHDALKDISDTDLQELVELAMTQLARSEAIAGIDGPAERQRTAYDNIVNLYRMQPSLNARDSERLMKQQYSTPTPFGYVMGQFVRAGGKTVGSMLEPSAGNGALTITVHPSLVHVNDIDETRLANLRKLGYGQVTAQDALLPFEGDMVDVVMTNPPFGAVPVKVYDGIFKISSLEGQMAINALDKMRDDGRAAIIIGGNTNYRENGSMNPKDAAFFGYLYSHYNVADVININGKSLYSRNGTGYDVRMILIDGRKTGEFKRVYPPVKSKARAEQVTTFDELYKRVQDDIQQIQQVGNKPADVQRDPGTAVDGIESTPVRSGSNLPNPGTRQRPVRTSDAVGSTQRSGSEQPVSVDAGRGAVRVDNGDRRDGTSTDDVPRSEGQQSGQRESNNGLDNERGGSGGDRRIDATTRPDGGRKRLAVKTGLGDEKVPYPNQSENGFTLMSVVPAAQAQVLQKSLGEIGDVDQFLVDELGYSSKDELYKYLAAEQIDSVALAIHQMNKGNAFIIGDMTGVGKGRQGAALIRYAVKQGKVPIYFTQKPTLFTDNYRDLVDIGSSGLRPFIMASVDKERSGDIVDAEGKLVYKIPTKKEKTRVYNYILEHGTLPPEYDYVLATYSQIQNGTADYSQNNDGSWKIGDRKLSKKSKGYTPADNNGQTRRDALAKLAEGNITILDESHTVGGDSGCGRYMQMLTSQAEGVTFLSATFAKRADNMPIYAQRTAIAEAGVKSSELIEAIGKGGVTLQEIMSKQLVESGQMIRRERSFDGVSIDWLSVPEDTDRRQRQQFNEVADIFNAIRNFQDDFITPLIDLMNENAAETGATVGHTQGTKDLGVKNVPFASKMYNLVNQLLFALKVDAVADRVIDNLRNGYKPVISFTNTMEGFLSSAPKGVAMDDIPNFSLTLMRALDGVMRYTEKDADENTEGGLIPLSQLSAEGQNAYNAIRNKIINLSADLPISPMDAIRMKIEDAGYSVAEITGRTMQLNRTDDGKYVVEARKDRDKKAAMRDFNSGKLDVLMINKSGSTGISLHASSKFEDQRQRVMVFTQFQSDINDEVQMRGRIDRSGQVVRGRYEYIMSTIPAEQRIQMMFKAKLKSLDANTTSSQKSKFNEMDIVDYLNKYGDEVVWEYMKEHPELEERLGDPLDMLESGIDDEAPRTSDKESSEKKVGCAAEISRYLAFLSVEEQDEIFREITEAYRVKIQLLDDAGENDLEITTMPLRAETKSKSIWHYGENPGSGNAFADNTYVEEVEVDVLKKPMKHSEITAATRKLMGDQYAEDSQGRPDWQSYAEAKKSEIRGYYEQKANDAIAKMQEAAEARIAKERERAVKNAIKARGRGENDFTDDEIQVLANDVVDTARNREAEKQRHRRYAIEQTGERICMLLDTFGAERIYVVPQDLKNSTPDMFTQTFGTFVGFKFNKSYTLGSSTAIFATLDGRRKVEVALNDPALNTIMTSTTTAQRYSPKEINSISMENWDSKVPTQTRQTRYIITGNLLQALVDTEKGEKTRGNLISYSTIDGDTRQGILMGTNFKPTDLRSSAKLSSRLEQIRQGDTVISENGDVQITKETHDWRHRGTYELRVPKSIQRGGIYTMNQDLLDLVEGMNFVTRGNSMVAYIHEINLAKVVDMLSRAPFNLTVLEESKLSEVNVGDDGDILSREGDGALSDEDLSNLNDAWSKMWGESRRTSKQRKAFAERERKNMEEHVKELAEKLHLDNVDIVDASTLTGKRAKSKGFYNKKTGKITIVLSNHSDIADIEKTLLHESVAHYGLRQLFGGQFDTFLDNVFASANKEVRGRIVELAKRHGWDFRVATEEYLASLAEDTDFENIEASWWREIKKWFMEFLHDIGFTGYSDLGISLSDNELRYLLWRSYENLTEPGRYRSILGEAADVAMQDKLSVGNYSEERREKREERRIHGHRGDKAAEPNMSKAMEETNERFNEQLADLTEDNADKVVLSLGRPSAVLRAAGVEDKSMKLYGNKVMKKMRKHGFKLSKLRNLPEAVANPIAVFNNYQKDGNRSILTELKTEQGHFLVTLDLGKAKDIDFNIVSSVFGKRGENIVNWLNSGFATDINKQKALSFLFNQSAPIAAAAANEELSSAAKVVENFENPRIDEGNYAGEDDDLFRGMSVRDRVTARDEYERMVKSGRNQFVEAVQDSMLGLKLLYQSILGKKTRMEDVPGYENAYLYENRMSSSNAGEQSEYFTKYMRPLLSEINSIIRRSGARSKSAIEEERRALTDYMMAKHGLERNQVMAEREAREAEVNGADYADAYAACRQKDYSGLTALTGEDDVAAAEAVAQQMVDDYEQAFDTGWLWAAVNNATKATLYKMYTGGLLSKESYESIRDMYEYYIPLRGWAETTSDEVYGYLTSKNGPLGGSIMKRAEGRKSLADDPIATIAMMADDGIRQSNRNIMKQRFLNFVLNHPSDAVSVSDLWLQYNEAADEWEPIFPDIDANDSPADVELIVKDFEEKMEQLSEQDPDKYKRGRDARNIPYKVVNNNLREHQVLVKRDGRTYVLTINGNPRAAQALNGLTNPDVEVSGFITGAMKGAEYVNRQLSAFYTTRNPDFVAGNFLRDMLYSNCMSWVKESPRYALRFHRNFGRFNPIVMRRLLSRWENGTLDMSDKAEQMFYQFMTNGGETGYTNVKDIEGHKKAVAAELKKQNANIGKAAWDALGKQFDLLNRSVENCARFAAFVTSREMGRSLDRSIWDAKEVSVNFNKKGSGGKMVDATGQTKLGWAGGQIGGWARVLYVFWNAGVQGMTNFGRNIGRHPKKAGIGASVLFALGYAIPLLAGMLGGDDDDDKNSYYNLPEYIRRSNICFRAGEQWITIPLPIEYRAIYGMGELASGVISDNEHYSDEELAYQIASQLSQTMPLDMLEGGGGVSPFIPSGFKPVIEVYVMKKGWTGLPIYKDTPFNQKDPEWTKAYQNADQTLVGTARWLNEVSGGDDYKKGKIDINPAKIEYMLNGYFGGLFTFPMKLKKSGETLIGDREFEWRNIPIANRVVKTGDERTEYRKLQKEYFKYKEEAEDTDRLLRKYDNAGNAGAMEYAEKADFLYNSPEYLRYEIFESYKSDMDAINEMLKGETDKDKRKAIEEDRFYLMREMVDYMNNPGKYIDDLLKSGAISEAEAKKEKAKLKK